MSTIVTRAGKGSPLTNNEVDSNFTNLNTDKIQVTGTPTTGQAIVWNGTAWVPGSSGVGDVVGPASSTDNALTRFDGTTGKLVQNSTATLSDTGALATANVTADYYAWNTGAGVTPAVGQRAWDANQGTTALGLLGGHVVTRDGQSLVAYVTNAEAVTITKGQAVYLFSAVGDRASVKLAYNTADVASAKTLGIVAEDIAAGASGFVMCQGVAYKMNTAAYNAGDVLYLGATAGSITTTKPYAPNHLVYLGVVEKANAGNGQIYVRVQNGYELDELHNVSAQSPTTGQTIVYNASTGLWEKNTVSLTAGVNGVLPTANGGTNLTSFTSGGVVYASSTSALATGSALTFDGTNLGVGVTPAYKLDVGGSSRIGTSGASTALLIGSDASTTGGLVFSDATRFISGSIANNPYLFYVNNAEQMRLTSTGLGIGTSSPAAKLEVNGGSAYVVNTNGRVYIQNGNTSGGAKIAVRGTSDTADGYLAFETYSREFGRFDSAGNLGLGVTPSAWNTFTASFQIAGTSLSGLGANNAVLASNAYFNTGWKYYGTDTASRYQQQSGQHQWYIAPSGTAGNAISFTQAMTLDAYGNLLVGTTAAIAKITVINTADVNKQIVFSDNATYYGSIGHNSGTGANEYRTEAAPYGEHRFFIGTSGTANMTLNSSGNLGLGVTPSAWGGGYKTFEVNAGSVSATTGAGNVIVSNNAYFSGANWIYKATGVASDYVQTGGAHWWRTAASGTAGNAISFTQAMTLDASGNLGIGTSSPAYKLDLLTSANFAGRWANATRGGYLYLDSGGPGIFNTAAYGGEGMYFHAGSNYIKFITNSVERMTLDASGNLLLGTTASNYRLNVRGAGSVGDSSVYAQFTTADTGTTGNDGLIIGVGVGSSPIAYINNLENSALAFATNGTERARISAAGGFSVGTTADPGAGAIYATGNITAYYSDARLKTVSGKIENALDKVAQLSGVYYTNNSVAKSFGYDSDEVQVGVLAQDVEAVLPQIVKAAPFDLDQDGNSKSGENYKTVQYERLVPLLIEAINELRAEVKALKGA